MEWLEAGNYRWRIERAAESDVGEIAALLADDDVGQLRESADLDVYLRAFREIDADGHQLLVVVRAETRHELLGTMQLTLIPGLSRAGATRLQIEGVRVAASSQRPFLP